MWIKNCCGFIVREGSRWRIKKKKKQVKLKAHNKISIILSITIFIYFLYGFYVNENSAGAGGYYGDFKIIWSNLILLKI